MDKDKDGKITLSEFEAAGLVALPSFEDLGAEGHHYDVESGAYQPPFRFSFTYHLPTEFFLHHEGATHMRIALPINLSQPNPTTRAISQYAGNAGSIVL
jgi:hypothetical protein